MTGHANIWHLFLKHWIKVFQGHIIFWSRSLFRTVAKSQNVPIAGYTSALPISQIELETIFCKISISLYFYKDLHIYNWFYILRNMSESGDPHWGKKNADLAS